MVISQKIIEIEMGYRGSKSIACYGPKDHELVYVKEQRVNSSQCINRTKRRLKCTLMGFERNCQVKIFSNQIFKNKQLYSSAVSEKMTISPQSSAPLKP
jgi:hypothetical protein